MKNIIKILVFLISVVTYAQVQPVNYYQQLNKVNEANENDSIQVLVRTIGNPDHNIVKYVNASDIGGGSGDMPDVSATERGVVNNTPLQELGGVDKMINGIRIGQGNVIGESADGNTFVGRSEPINVITGDYNTSFGDFGLYQLSSGSWNSSLGASSLLYNTTGHRNIAVGTSLYWNTIGHRNTGVGFNAGYAQTTGNYNTYLGSYSGYDAGVGNYNVAVGYGALATAIAGYASAGSTRNNNNNVFIGSRITIPDEVNSVFAVDNKGNTATAYNNALLYGNFADRFLRINGRFEIDDTTMPTADIDFTKKLVWNPTTGVVGITDDAGAAPEFVKITEGSNTGWGLKYRADNPDKYGSIGSNAIDLSYSSSNTNEFVKYGAEGLLNFTVGEAVWTRGLYSSIVGGRTNFIGSGRHNSIIGGENNRISITSGYVAGNAANKNNVILGGMDNWIVDNINIRVDNSSIIGGRGNKILGRSGFATDNSSLINSYFSQVNGGSFSTIISGVDCIVIGNRAVAIGAGHTVNSLSEISLGSYSTIATGSRDTWTETNRLFNVGNGQSTTTRSDAFTILKNGLATLPSVTNALIDAEPTGKAVVTKEWVLANSGGGDLTLEQARQNGNQIDGDVSFRSPFNPYTYLTLNGDGFNKTAFGSTQAIVMEGQNLTLSEENADGKGWITLEPYSSALLFTNKNNNREYAVFVQDGAATFSSAGAIPTTEDVGFYINQDLNDLDIENTKLYQDGGSAFIKEDYLYAQRSYVNKSNSYSTMETKTGGTWIDDKPIYRIVKLTADADPSDIELTIRTWEVDIYTVIEYTKTTD